MSDTEFAQEAAARTALSAHHTGKRATIGLTLEEVFRRDLKYQEDYKYLSAVLAHTRNGNTYFNAPPRYAAAARHADLDVQRIDGVYLIARRPLPYSNEYAP